MKKVDAIKIVEWTKSLVCWGFVMSMTLDVLKQVDDDLLITEDYNTSWSDLIVFSHDWLMLCYAYNRVLEDANRLGLICGGHYNSEE